MPVSSNQLTQIRELIKAGKKKQALSQIAGLIERDHDNPELWWLLANATDDVNQANRALEEMLVLKPNDERAQKLLNRLSTRQLLKQMGVESTTTRPQPKRNVVLLGVGGGTAVVVLLVALAAASGLLRREQGPLPTLVVAAAATEENTAAPAVTEEQVETEDQFPTAEVNVSTVEVLVITEEAPFIEPTIAPTVTVFDFTSEMGEVTVEVAPPTLDGTLAQVTPDSSIPLPSESTAEVGAPIGAPPLSQEVIPPVVTEETPPQTNPESTQEVVPPDVNNAQAAVPTPKVIEVRGQILDGQTRRDLIEPYNEHGWTFSGYRDEQITLELVNVTGNGNPSLELRDEAGTVLTSDLDATAGNTNKDSLIELSLPADGIYTVVVRMAAVKQQLYTLKLTRTE